MLFCPKCKSSELKVWHSKPRDIEGGKTRIRQCMDCKTRFTTLETPYEIPKYERPKKEQPLKSNHRKKIFDKRGKRKLEPRRIDPDFDAMSDEELEAHIFSN